LFALLLFVVIQMTLGQETTVEPLGDAPSYGIPTHSLRINPIAELPDLLEQQQKSANWQGNNSGGGVTVDVVGIVLESQPIQGQASEPENSKTDD
jgi:hypothetical protein